MKTFRTILAISLLIAACLPSQAFRAYQSSGENIIIRAERTFQVKSQVEHYRTIIIKPDLSITEGDLVLAYLYEDDKVYGLVHLMPNEENEGHTVVSVQQQGKKPRIYYWEPGFDEVKQLRASDWRGNVGGTPWNFEDMLDDDKEAWNYINKGVYLLEGKPASMIESTYEDPHLKRLSAYSKRHTYIARDDNRFLKSVFFDRNGVPVKTLRADLHENTGTEEDPLIRARRITMTEHATGLVAIMQAKAAVYDTPLPKSFFEIASMPTWGKKELPRALELARGS